MTTSNAIDQVMAQVAVAGETTVSPMGGLKQDLIDIIRPMDNEGNQLPAMTVNVGLTWEDAMLLFASGAASIFVGELLAKKFG